MFTMPFNSCLRLWENARTSHRSDELWSSSSLLASALSLDVGSSQDGLCRHVAGVSSVRVL